MAWGLGELWQERHICCLMGAGWVVMSIPVNLEEGFSTRRSLGKHLLNRESRQTPTPAPRKMLQEPFSRLDLSTQGGTVYTGRDRLHREGVRTLVAASFGRKAGRQLPAQRQELKKGGKHRALDIQPLNSGWA